MSSGPSESPANNRDLDPVQNRGRNMEQSRNAQGAHSRSLSKASSWSVGNSEKLYLHAQRQRQYKKELKDWYDKKHSLEEQSELVFAPQLNPHSLELARKRDRTVIEHAKEYARIPRRDLDKDYVEYQKNKNECTFRPQTVKH